MFIIDNLIEEHGSVRRIELICDYLVKNINTVSPHIILRVAKLIRNFIQNHHEKSEEKIVFSKLIDSMPRIILPLTAQHKHGKQLITTVLQTPDDKRVVASALSQFSKMYNAHGTYEDTIAYPAFRKLVKGQEDKYQEEEDEEKSVMDAIIATEEELGISIERYTNE